MPLSAARHARPGLLALTIAVLAWRLWVVPHLGISLYVDEAQYWTWARDLAWGYFSKPPGVAGLIALSTALFGDGILGVKALGMLCYPAAAWIVFAIARRLYDERTAFWSGVAVLTLPMFSFLGLFVSTDALLTLFWVLGLYAYLNAVDRGRWRDWLFLGAVCGLGLMSKYTMAAWMLAALLHLAVFHRRQLASPRPWIAALLALLILAPNIAWNVANDFPTLKHTADITLNKRAGGGFKALGEFLGAQWIAFGPVLGSVFLILLASVRRTWRDERLRLLLWFSLPLWAVVSIQAVKSNANANWAAPAFAPAAIAVVAWLLARHRQRLLAVGLAINLALAAVVYHWPQILAAASVKEASRKDPFTRARGWDELGRQLHPLAAAHPDAVLVADNRTLLAHMLYELRDLAPAAASWNPDRRKSDHYKLTTDLTPYVGRDALLITDVAPGPDLTGRFAAAEHLRQLRAPLDENRARTMDVYLLHGFKGY
ncbi:MAG TPA: glycosyltransferase family 39 protein [Rhodocyclaceae bacterium]|nr:glycosyltransferase family 39 protein [Rhodocyclaceae bacterium]